MTVLPRAVQSVGEELWTIEEGEEQRLAEEEVKDQHPDKGLISGSSKDGLSMDVATESHDEGRDEEGEEARTPRRLPAPQYVSKAEREEHELTHTPYRSWCHHCVRCMGGETLSIGRRRMKTREGRSREFHSTISS